MLTLASLIYLLCTGTAVACFVLLLRGYLRTRTPLLFWSGLCFGFLALDNLLLFVDRILLPSHDYTLMRAPAGLIAVALLLYGMIWKMH